jgi:hypothetical protein
MLITILFRFYKFECLISNLYLNLFADHMRLLLTLLLLMIARQSVLQGGPVSANTDYSYHSHHIADVPLYSFFI